MPLTSPSSSETAQILNDINNFNYGTIRSSQENEDAPTHADNTVEIDAAENDEGGDDTVLPDENNNENRGRGVVEILTRRLRCLFSTITWPIVPLGSLVSMCLLWVLYCAFVVDIKSSCSHPLHAYALASLCFVLYAPYHSQIRSYIFRYSRERDGPIQPTRVRLYDQLFHTLCILYVYGGVTVLQSCQQDFGDGATAAATTSVDDYKNDTTSHHATKVNTCEATCPHLYAATNIYVTMLELFTLSLILPLLFLPCIYLWILRRASTAAESFFSREGGGGDDILFGRGGISGSHGGGRLSVEGLMGQLERVKLVYATNQDGDKKIFLQSITDGKIEKTKEILVKDCCICMSDFNIFVANDIETGSKEEDEEDPIVRTECEHLFHERCLKSWVGGRWNVESTENRRAQRTCCPLCRKDLRPPIQDDPTN